MARVLFPLDGTQESYDALDEGIRLLGSANDVTLLAVRAPGFEHAPADVIEAFEDDKEDQVLPTEASCQEVLDEAMRICTDAGVAASGKTRTGRAMQEILAEAAEHDVLVMHGLSRTRMADLLHMAQGGKIARRAPCHVLLMRTE